MKKDDQTKDAFTTLFQLDVNGHTEVKKTGGTTLTYLSWAWAWAEVMKLFPDASYEIVKNENNLPYFHDALTGYMVYTRVTINGVTREMWLPVMDGANKAMKSQPYDIQTKYGVTHVNAATMFDINKTVMRCLVKNLAMFGLGLYIYAGEDLPETPEDEQTQKKDDQTKPKAKPSETAPRVTPAKKPAAAPAQAPSPVVVSADLAKQKAKQAWISYRQKMSAWSVEAQTDGFKELIKKVCNKTESAKVTADEWNAVMHMIGALEPQQSIADI